MLVIAIQYLYITDAPYLVLLLCVSSGVVQYLYQRNNLEPSIYLDWCSKV